MKGIVKFWSIIFATLAVLICIWVGMSYGEKAAYQRLTGIKIPLWTAMFVQLQVQTEPRHWTYTIDNTGDGTYTFDNTGELTFEETDGVPEGRDTP